MNLDQLTHPLVRAAIDALQRGDRTAWAACFAADARLLDDGRATSLAEFTRDAVGSERFTSIDRVGNAGLEIIGHFHSDRWGDFRTYFRFHIGADGKCDQLDIGQQ